MTRRIVDDRIENAEARLAMAKVKIPEAKAALNEQRAFINALRANRTDNGPGQPNAISDPTLSAAMALDTLAHKARIIDDYVRSLGFCIDKLEEAAADALGYRVPTEMQGERCDYTWTVLDRGLEITHRCVEYAEYEQRPDGTIYWRQKCSAHRKKLQRERGARREEDAA